MIGEAIFRKISKVLTLYIAVSLVLSMVWLPCYGEFRAVLLAPLFVLLGVRVFGAAERVLGGFFARLDDVPNTSGIAIAHYGYWLVTCVWGWMALAASAWLVSYRTVVPVLLLSYSVAAAPLCIVLFRRGRKSHPMEYDGTIVIFSLAAYLLALRAVLWRGGGVAWVNGIFGLTGILYVMLVVQLSRPYLSLPDARL